MKVFLGADHRGFSLKESLKTWLDENKFTTEDLGAFSLDPNDDYVDFAEKVGHAVVENLQENKGIIVCGSGVGVDIAANKIEGIRAGLGFSESEIKAARNDDDINVLALPADFVDIDAAKKIVNVFLATPFAKADRFQRRINKIGEIEESQE